MTGGRKILGAYAGNDVWRTSDGVTWEELPDAPFNGRAYHAMFYHNACVFFLVIRSTTMCGGAATMVRAGSLLGLHRGQP